MLVLPFLSGRDHHRFATAHAISSLLFPHSRHDPAPGIRWFPSHLLTCSAGLWKWQGEVSRGSGYAIGRRVRAGKDQALSGW